MKIYYFKKVGGVNDSKTDDFDFEDFEKHSTMYSISSSETDLST